MLYTDESVLNLLSQIELGLASDSSVATAFRKIGVGGYAHSVGYLKPTTPTSPSLLSTKPREMP